MALFRKFFYRKPPDGLLEISERVYVFDCCFSTDVLEEEEYKVYIGGIVAQLQGHFPDASFMVFNFREGENQSQITNILSEYDMTVMDYPRHYEGCPLLTMEMIHHFLRSSESWLSLGQQNLLLMHCERGGWPVLAFMLAALLIYRKQYTVEQKTLDMIYKQAPRELLQLLQPLNPLPSQLRYLQYVSRRNVGSEWPPLDRALTLDCVILRMLPNFDGEGGCRPIFRIYGQDPFIASDRTPKVLFSTPKKSKSVRLYRQADCELVKIDIHCHIQGDVVLECISVDEDLEREEMMFRVMFNTAFIRSNILMLNRDEIDILWDAKDRFPKDFRAEVLLSEMDAAASLITMDLASVEDKEGLPIEAFAKVHEIFSNVDWLDVKGDAALHVLQKIKSSNAFQEMIETCSPQKDGTDAIPQKPSPEMVKEILQSDESKEITMKTSASPPKLSVSPKQSPDSDKNNNVQIHDLQVALQRPSKSKIITQRMPGSTWSNQVSLCNSLQGSPLPVSRYHSAPSALGITALLHDHAAFGSSETACTVTSEADSSLSAGAASGVKGSLSSASPPNLITSSASTTEKILVTPSATKIVPTTTTATIILQPQPSQTILHHPTAPPPPPPPALVTSMTSVSPPQHGTTSSVKGQATPAPSVKGQETPVPPPPPPPCLKTPSSSVSSDSGKSTHIPPAPTPPSGSTFRTTALPPPPPPPLPPPLPIVASSTPSPRPPPPRKDAGATVAPPPPSPPKKDADASIAPPPPPPPTKNAGATVAPPPPPPPMKNAGATVGPPMKNAGAAVAPPPPPPPMKNAGATVAPPPPPPPHSGHAPSPATTPSVPPPPPRNSSLVPPAPPLKGPGAASLQSKSSGSTSLGVKGRSLTRMTSPRSMQSTQSSSKRASLKPLHWVKVTRAMQGSLWAETQKTDEASKAPEFDMSELESLFSAAVPNSDHQGSGDKSNRRASLGQKSDKVHLVDLRRANNCEIMLTKVKIPLPDLMSSLLALDDSILDIDQVDNLIKFCPTKEEMELLKGYSGDRESLGKCEQFFLELMKVPRVESKLRVFSFKIQFRSQVAELRSNLNIVNSAAEEVRNSVKLKRIMQTILSLGNALNQGTARGSAIGFRLDSLLKLTDTRARNNKMTLMHYLCKVLTEKLPELLDFPKNLISLEAAAKMQLKSLAEEMQAISKGLEKVEQELTASENDGPVSQTFRKTLMEFLVVAEAEVRALTSLYSGVGRNADALALYFGEDPARCPFEQVVATLLNFVKMFVRAHEENRKQLELEKKKAQKEAENEKTRLNAPNKGTENVLQSPVRNLNTE